MCSFTYTRPTKNIKKRSEFTVSIPKWQHTSQTQLFEMSLLEIIFLNVTTNYFFLDNSQKLLSVNNPQYKALFIIEYYLMTKSLKKILKISISGCWIITNSWFIGFCCVE